MDGGVAGHQFHHHSPVLNQLLTSKAKPNNHHHNKVGPTSTQLSSNAIHCKQSPTSSTDDCLDSSSNHHNYPTSQSNGRTLSVQYVNVSYHNGHNGHADHTHTYARPMPTCISATTQTSSTLLLNSKTSALTLNQAVLKRNTDQEKRRFLALHSSDLDSSNELKPVISSSQRILISPTDFLSLHEEASSIPIKNSAVKKDVNLSTSCLEIIKRSDSNLAISLDRYCESPFLLDSHHHREIHLISDDDVSNNGRSSRMSEPPEEMSTDDLFATTLGDQHPSLREVVITPSVDDESARSSPVKGRIEFDSHILSAHIKEEKMDDDDDDYEDEDLLQLRFRESDLVQCKSEHESIESHHHQHSLSPVGDGVQSPDTSHCQSQLPDSTVANSSSPTSTSPVPDSVVPTEQITLPTSSLASSTITGGVVSCTPSAGGQRQQTPLDIKILPAGLLQLAANLAAVFPSNGVQKQIAIQLLREDGTSIILPITTRGTPPDGVSSSSNGPLSGVTIKTEPGSDTSNSQGSTPCQRICNGGPTNGSMANHGHGESDRPFKCELCNSTFTRLGNYTRHKKIHSLPSKQQQEDQRFRCDICGKSFIQRCDLARHLHIHRGTEPHRCPQCGKGYIRHSDLVTHQRFHNKEKPFACPHCSKGFCQRGDLNRHLRSIHLQLKPILCSYCHKKFAKEETLLRHINATHRDKVPAEK